MLPYSATLGKLPELVPADIRRSYTRHAAGTQQSVHRLEIVRPIDSQRWSRVSALVSANRCDKIDDG